MTNLQGKVAVIAGAGGGLGRICTQVFADAGAKLALLGRDQKELEKLASSMGLDADRFLALDLDLSLEEANKDAGEKIKKHFGSLDIFINLIGGWAGGKSFIDTPQDDFDFMAKQHIFSMVSMIKGYLPIMKAGSWGRILAVSSPSATRPPGDNAAYAAAKAAQEALVLSLAAELKGSGITANVLQVYAIDVEHKKIKNPSEKTAGWTTPEEISATLLHLCSEHSGMINGARIPLFGEF